MTEGQNLAPGAGYRLGPQLDCQVEKCMLLPGTFSMGKSELSHSMAERFQNEHPKRKK